MIPAPIESRFDSYHDYRRAVADLLALAQRSIEVFDPDLKETGFESPGAIEALTRLASARRDSRVRIVVHRTGHVERHCPRLQAMFRRYGHVVSVRQSPEDLRLLTDCFMLADGVHAVVRFHADHARGKFLVHQEQEAAGLQRRFDELWDLSLPTLASTTLGL